MSETLEIPVTYKNEELLIKAQVLRFGYVQHIILDINGHAITIERDEEGNYRALAEPEKISDKNIDIELIKAVVEVLEGL